MKKTKLCLCAFLLVSGLCSCGSTNELTFAEKEYLIQSGESISVEQNKKGVTYQMVGTVPSGITLSENGVFTFDSSIRNYTQVLVIAKYKELVSEAVVATLYYEYLDSEITFDNAIDYIMDGEFITALDQHNYGITYSLNEIVPGISIHPSSGKVTYTDIVEDGTPFDVVASSGKGGNKSTHRFYAAREHLVTTQRTVGINQKNALEDNQYILDFSYAKEYENENIVALMDEYNQKIDPKFYAYDISSKTLTLKKEYIRELSIGEHHFKIITPRNSVAIQLNVATKYILTPEDLVSVSEDLGGYYIQMADIDLKEYLSDKPLGWTPIGRYHDVLDSTEATKDAFRGTYDGNGHVVTSLLANRTDEASFNFGLFGYVTSASVIRNLGVKGEAVCSSYSGGLVGSNSGKIENCYADVLMRVYSGGNSYRYVGGLVGNNFGDISYCYAVGNVRSDKQYGSFVGSNEGSIQHCYTKKTRTCPDFVGYGKVAESNVNFESLDEMKAFDFSSVFTSSYWNCEIGSLPKLVPDQY